MDSFYKTFNANRPGRFFYLLVFALLSLSIELYMTQRAGAIDQLTAPSNEGPGDNSDNNKNESEKVCWLNYTEAVKKGKEKNLPIVIVFYNDGCRKCEILEKNGFNRPDIASYINKKFAAVRLNGGENIELTKKYRVNVYPTVWFLDSDTKEIDALIGYVNPDRLFLILKYIGDDIYKKKSFSDYEKEQKK